MRYRRHMQKEHKSSIIKIKAKSVRLDETSEILTTLITSLMNPKKSINLTTNGFNDGLILPVFLSFSNPSSY